MTREQIIALSVAIVVVAFAIAIFLVRSVHARRLKHAFGAEYQRLVRELGSRRAAHRELEQRKHRVERLHIHDLDREDAARFRREWIETQAQFVDEPNGAIKHANALVKEVMAARGYPMGDFEARVADLSVDHAKFIDSYRAAHEIAMKSADGSASTEELRGAMVHYREMFLDLLGGAPEAEPTGKRPHPGQRRFSHAT